MVETEKPVIATAVESYDSSTPISKKAVELVMKRSYQDLYYSPLEEDKGFTKKTDIIETNKQFHPQIKLQLYYKKAFEYRMLCAFEATSMLNYSDRFTFTLLMMSTVSSILLLSGKTEASSLIAAIISALSVPMTAFASYMKYAHNYEVLSLNVAVFAGIQRDFLTILNTGEDDAGDGFESVYARFTEAVENMPLISTATIHSYKDENEKPLFKTITNKSIWRETKDNIGSIKELGLFELW